MQPSLQMIAAVDYSGGFARNGKIPWHFKEDFQHFQNITKGHTCIMGRKTYEDMLRMALDREDARIQRIITKEKKRCRDWGIPYIPTTTPNLPRTNIPAILPNRESFVLTRNNKAAFAGATPITSVRQVVYDIPKDKQIFILGGERLFNEMIVWTQVVYLTIVKDYYQCDKFFPIKYLQEKFYIAKGNNNPHLYFVEYRRKANK